MGTAGGGGGAGRSACCPVDNACARISSRTCWMSWSRSENACVGAVVVLVPLGGSNGVAPVHGDASGGARDTS